MKKRAISLFLLGITLLGGVAADFTVAPNSAVVAEAATTGTGVVTATTLNVRSGAGTSYSILGTLSNGATVTIVDSTNGWYKIKYGSGYGYVSASYINVTSTTQTGTVTATTLNVRSGAGTSYSILGTLSNGATVTIVDSTNGWYKIKYGSGYGYVSASYISVSSGDVSATRQAILSRAREMINFSWSSSKSFYKWNSTDKFAANTTYTGMPYTQSGYQMTSGTNFKNKIAAATGSLSTTINGKNAPLYGNDCSGFVSAAWGISRHTTSTLPNVSYQISYDNLQPGDILNLAGSHVVLFAGWEDSAKTQMRILEQTPPKAKESVKAKSYYTSRGYLARRWNNL